LLGAPVPARRIMVNIGLKRRASGLLLYT